VSNDKEWNGLGSCMCKRQHFTWRSHGSEKAVQQSRFFFASAFLKVPGRSAAATWGPLRFGARKPPCETFDAEYDMRGLRWRRGRAAGGRCSRAWAGTRSWCWKRRRHWEHVVQAAYWYWVPNCRMRKAGIPDTSSTSCATWRGLANRSTDLIIPAMSSSGISMWRAIYDNSSVGTELLSEKGAAAVSARSPVPDYFAEMETSAADRGSLSQGRRALNVRRRQVATRTFPRRAGAMA